MARVDRLSIAADVARQLPELVRCGKYTPAAGTQPAYWGRDIGEWQVYLTEHVLLSSEDPALSMLLDVWPRAGGGKVLSVSWMPDRPWVPPRAFSASLGPGKICCEFDCAVKPNRCDAPAELELIPQTLEALQQLWHGGGSVAATSAECRGLLWRGPPQVIDAPSVPK
jgi:hypothetical protein